MSTEAIDLLKSIDTSLKHLLALQAGSGQSAASDADLDNPKYGDPVIKAADPRDWTGASQKGNRFSQCPPEYLDLLADRLDYFAEKAEKEGKLTSSGKPVAPFNRKDAARARGWAARLRNGWKAAGAQWADDAQTAMANAGWASPEPLTADDIPF